MTTSYFDFGENWYKYVQNNLTAEKVESARKDFHNLIGGVSLKGATFLDVGFGQGLASFFAAEAGAKVLGIDLGKRCLDAALITGKMFPAQCREEVEFFQGSILSQYDREKLALRVPAGFEIIHAWGVLHHTGDMKASFGNCAALLGEKGLFFVAIYNAHWTAPLWKQLKGLYNWLNPHFRKAFVLALAPVIFFAKLLVTRRNPLRKERGMNFYVDLVDWVGGYPYEWATVEEISILAEKHNLKLVRVIRPEVPTGCNEYLFVKG
jgi:2-polyprenyl-3-methyl-5-hydroxy-6-metoxy-1,4-benzoquinol methylase